MHITKTEAKHISEFAFAYDAKYLVQISELLGRTLNITWYTSAVLENSLLLVTYNYE